MRDLTEIVKQFKQSWTEELSCENIERACRDSGMTWIESTLNPIVTVRIFMLQILHGNTACTDLPHIARMTFSAAAYCKARMRVKLEAFQLLLKRCADTMHRETLDTGRWLGHRVFMVDGSSFSMPDTPALRNYFGGPTGQKQGCGFPVAHWLVLMHMGTGMLTKMIASPLTTGDMSKTAKLHPELQSGDVLVADRAFCSFAHLCLLIERGVHVVLRVHHTMNIDFTPGRPHAVPNRGKGSKRKGLPRSMWVRTLGKNDQIVVWLKNTRAVPTWMSSEQYASLPREVKVRELRYEVHQKGFRAKTVTLVTTLLDERTYSMNDVAELYRRRWEQETNFAHMKTTMKMDVLKCKTVDGVLRELHVFALIYNMIRQVMVAAAHRQRVPVNRISFIDAMRWLNAAQSNDILTNLVVLPNRPHRYEPRVRKRRPKKYKLMNKPRCQLKKELTI